MLITQHYFWKRSHGIQAKIKPSGCPLSTISLSLVLRTMPMPSNFLLHILFLRITAAYYPALPLHITPQYLPKSYTAETQTMVGPPLCTEFIYFNTFQYHSNFPSTQMRGALVLVFVAALSLILPRIRSLSLLFHRTSTVSSILF